MLAMQKIGQDTKNWTDLHKLRYIYKMRKEAGLPQPDLGLLDDLALENEKNENLNLDLPNFSQENIKLNKAQDQQLLQHIFVPLKESKITEPCYFRLKPLIQKSSSLVNPFINTYKMADHYQIVKIDGDVGREVIPIGWRDSAPEHLKTHAKWRYQDAFSKL